MSYSMKTLFYLLAGAEHRQQQGTTSLINKHLLNWSTLGVYFTTFLFQRADCSLNSRKWMSRVLLLGLVIEWTNRIVSRTYSDVSFHQFRILLVCVFLFSNWITVGAGPFSSIFDFNKKIPIKRRYYFAPLVTSSLDSISLMLNKSCDLKELFSDWFENDRWKYSFETNTIHFQLIPIYFPSLSW